MTRKGVVKELDGKTVIVSLMDAACDGCSTPCGACRREQKPLFARVFSDVAVQEGDRVELSCSSSVVVWYSVFFFLLPLFAGVLSGALFVSRLGEGSAALVGALIALALFFLLAVIFSRPRFREKNTFRIVRVLGADEPEKELDKP